jgi:hypothetical protein
MFVLFSEWMLLPGPVYVLVEEIVAGIPFRVQRFDYIGAGFGIAQRDRDIAKPLSVTDSSHRATFGSRQPGVFGPGE